jgi:MFS family permease
MADRFGARPVVIAGLIVLGSGTFLMTALALDTSLVMIVGILILLGSAGALLQQVPVSAMSNIGKDERQAIANGSTLLTVLHATAAPMGVALLSSIVQIRSQQYRLALAGSELAPALVEPQSTLLAMHESFFLAGCLVVVALIAMLLVPKRQLNLRTPPQENEVVIENALI